MNLMVTDKPQPNKMPTICLNMIVKNEAKIIVTTLNNLAEHINFDYWVISDTGSTDGTQQIIRDYFLEKGIPGELFQHEWHDFGYNRTKALECAYDKTDFLLVFDADDKLHGDFKLPFIIGKPLTAYADRYMLKIGKGFEYVRPLLMNNHKRWSFRGVLHEFLQNLEPVNEEVTLGGDYYIESGRSGNRSQNPTKYYDDAIILENAYKVELALPDKGLSGRYAFYCARSYKDAGEKYYEKALEWYKLLMALPNHWNQEKYYAALEVGGIYLQQKQMDQAVIYLLKTLEYDGERIEGLIMAIEYFYQTGQHVLINALYHKYKNYNKHLMGKLFINMNYYQDRLEFFNAISAYYVDDKASGYLCCKHILNHQLVGENELVVTATNFVTFYKDFLEKDLDTLSFFHNIDTLLYKNNALAKNTQIIELWNLLFTKNRTKLTTLNKEVIKKIKKNQLQINNLSRAATTDKILITFTTCKRLDLFKETLHSILNHWTDVDLITDWFCVDDNSSSEDRHYMKTNYTWIEYYMKTLEEKGHRSSMNIIWQKLETLKPTYWIHMEDDFIFHHPMAYVKQARDFLQNANANANANNIKQIVFNRNYAETIEDYKVGGHLPLSNYADIVVHDHRSDGALAPYPNSHYWPHYSFRPSMVLVSALMPLGNFDSPNQFFERDYADKWNAMNYKTAFFNRITHRHIGRLTSEISNDKVKNAYQLNDEAQFQSIPTPSAHAIKVINLERRNDRKNAVIKEFKDHGITDYSFFKAVDGKNLVPTNELKHLFRGNDFGNRKGVIGCALSHLKLWQDLVADKQQNYYVIFEDDITLSTNKFKERFNELKPEFEKQDLLLLGYHMFTNERSKPEITARYDSISADTQLQLKPYDEKLYIGGFFSYAINKAGAQKLLNYIEANGIKHGIDYVIKKVAGLNIMELQPFLVFSPWYETRANPVDSDIQDLRDCFNFTTTIEDQFDFIVGLDQIDYDLYHKTGTLNEFMSVALRDENCVGFNTLGFFKNKIDLTKLMPSAYFKATDGIYIKKSYVKEYAMKDLERKAKSQGQVPDSQGKTTIRLKMLCNWCSSEQLCKEWQHMADGIKNVKLTWSDSVDEIDYYVIINYPQHGSNDYYDPARTIVFQMEPWVADETKRWGVKTWGKWAQPDPTKFFKVFTHKTHLNNVQWQINYPFASKPITLGGDLKQNRVATICSAKNFDEGHVLRNKFLHFLTDNDSADSADSVIDIWGKENYHDFKTGYKGPVPADDKFNVYANYKYCLAVENNQEHNYATEKLWEAILCESLCFYWGCPNLEEYIDPQAFVRLPLEDPAGALKIIEQAIAEDWWTQRSAVIKQMKEKILTQLGFFPLMAAVCSKKL